MFPRSRSLIWLLSGLLVLACQAEEQLPSEPPGRLDVAGNACPDPTVSADLDVWYANPTQAQRAQLCKTIVDAFGSGDFTAAGIAQFTFYDLLLQDRGTGAFTGTNADLVTLKDDICALDPRDQKNPCPDWSANTLDNTDVICPVVTSQIYTDPGPEKHFAVRFLQLAQGSTVCLSIAQLDVPLTPAFDTQCVGFQHPWFGHDCAPPDEAPPFDGTAFPASDILDAEAEACPTTAFNNQQLWLQKPGQTPQPTEQVPSFAAAVLTCEEVVADLSGWQGLAWSAVEPVFDFFEVTPLYGIGGAAGKFSASHYGTTDGDIATRGVPVFVQTQNTKSGKTTFTPTASALVQCFDSQSLSHLEGQCSTGRDGKCTVVVEVPDDPTEVWCKANKTLKNGTYSVDPVMYSVFPNPELNPLLTFTLSPN